MACWFWPTGPAELSCLQVPSTRCSPAPNSLAGAAEHPRHLQERAAEHCAARVRGPPRAGRRRRGHQEGPGQGGMRCRCSAVQMGALLPTPRSSRWALAAGTGASLERPILTPHLQVTLLGKEAEVRANAEKFGIDLSGIDILDYLASPLLLLNGATLVPASVPRGASPCAGCALQPQAPERAGVTVSRRRPVRRRTIVAHRRLSSPCTPSGALSSAGGHPREAEVRRHAGELLALVLRPVLGRDSSSLLAARGSGCTWLLQLWDCRSPHPLPNRLRWRSARARA